MTRDTRFRLLLGAIVSLLAAAPYLAGLPGSFLFDDIPNIVNNGTLHLQHLSVGNLLDILSTPQPSGTMRGLPTLTFAVDYWRAGGADPATFKVTNILIHSLTACALIWFFHILLSLVRPSPRHATWLAAALTLAWACHPLQVSAVLYSVQRMQTLGTLFLVVALIAYLLGRRRQLAGQSGRGALLVSLLSWAFALNCKEDTVLLPAYTLALELTVLRFGAADIGLAQRWRRFYQLSTLLGSFVVVAWVIPRYWTWDAYPGRDFSTPERLLTETRVLCMYLWQIVLPLPSHMPFHYDWLEPSRGLLQPWTTLPALLLLGALVAVAWHQRHTRPLLALGILLFLFAHVITSSVIPLELAYEHRNNFALIGATLAIASAGGSLLHRLHASARIRTGACLSVLAILFAATVHRAHSWHSALSLAETNAAAAPASPRAWIALCDTLIKTGGGPTRENPMLDRAVDACTSGAAAAPDSLNNSALLLVLKTARGDISPLDWTRFRQRILHARRSSDNLRAPLILTYYRGEGVPIDPSQTLATLDVLVRHMHPSPPALVRIADSIRDDLGLPDKALPYYLQAIDAIPATDPYPLLLMDELKTRGRGDLAVRIKTHAMARLNAIGTPQANRDAPGSIR